jgi:hypothetical protein
MSTTEKKYPARGRIAVATVLAAGAMVAGAFASAAAAIALPPWDVVGYENCVRDPLAANLSEEGRQEWYRGCCESSGGIWKAGQGCFAPPGEADNVPGNPNPVGPPGKPRPPIVPGGPIA